MRRRPLPRRYRRPPSRTAPRAASRATRAATPGRLRRSGSWSLRLPREAAHERRAAAFGVFIAHRAAVGRDERAHDREAKPRPRPIGPGVDALELLEDALAGFGRDAGAMVGNAQLDALTSDARADEDLRARRR